MYTATLRVIQPHCSINAIPVRWPNFLFQTSTATYAIHQMPRNTVVISPSIIFNLMDKDACRWTTILKQLRNSPVLYLYCQSNAMAIPLSVDIATSCARLLEICTKWSTQIAKSCLVSWKFLIHSRSGQDALLSVKAWFLYFRLQTDDAIEYFWR